MSDFKKSDYAGDYAQDRLSSERDDRSDRKKINADARLRGRLGMREANRIIEAIDKIKSYR